MSEPETRDQDTQKQGDGQNERKGESIRDTFQDSIVEQMVLWEGVAGGFEIV